MYQRSLYSPAEHAVDVMQFMEKIRRRKRGVSGVLDTPEGPRGRSNQAALSPEERYESDFVDESEEGSSSQVTSSAIVSTVEPTTPAGRLSTHGETPVEEVSLFDEDIELMPASVKKGTKRPRAEVEALPRDPASRLVQAQHQRAAAVVKQESRSVAAAAATAGGGATATVKSSNSAAAASTVPAAAMAKARTGFNQAGDARIVKKALDFDDSSAQDIKVAAASSIHPSANVSRQLPTSSTLTSSVSAAPSASTTSTAVSSVVNNAASNEPIITAVDGMPLYPPDLNGQHGRSGVGVIKSISTDMRDGDSPLAHRSLSIIIDSREASSSKVNAALRNMCRVTPFVCSLSCAQYVLSVSAAVLRIPYSDLCSTGSNSKNETWRSELDATLRIYERVYVIAQDDQHRTARYAEVAGPQATLEKSLAQLFSTPRVLLATAVDDEEVARLIRVLAENELTSRGGVCVPHLHFGVRKDAFEWLMTVPQMNPVVALNLLASYRFILRDIVNATAADLAMRSVTPRPATLPGASVKSPLPLARSPPAASSGSRGSSSGGSSNGTGAADNRSGAHKGSIGGLTMSQAESIRAYFRKAYGNASVQMANAYLTKSGSSTS